MTNLLINTSDIHQIVIKPTKYYICIECKKNDAFSWYTTVFGFGSISSYTDRIEVCETNHPSDYKILTDWIDKN